MSSNESAIKSAETTQLEPNLDTIVTPYLSPGHPLKESPVVQEIHQLIFKAMCGPLKEFNERMISRVLATGMAVLHLFKADEDVDPEVLKAFLLDLMQEVKKDMHLLRTSLSVHSTSTLWQLRGFCHYPHLNELQDWARVQGGWTVLIGEEIPHHPKPQQLSADLHAQSSSVFATHYELIGHSIQCCFGNLQLFVHKPRDPMKPQAFMDAIEELADLIRGFVKFYFGKSEKWSIGIPTQQDVTESAKVFTKDWLKIIAKDNEHTEPRSPEAAWLANFFDGLGIPHKW